MVNGLYFYWVCWLILILLTFFQTFRTYYYMIVSWLFLLMMTLSFTITMFDFELSISFLILLIGSSYLYSQYDRTLQTLFITFTIMTGYISLRIWEVIAPVWFFIPSMMMIAVIISIKTILLLRSFEHRIVHILFGTTFGELFHSLILNGYYLNNEVVPLLFFDYLALTILIIICVQIIKHIFASISQLIVLLFNKNYKN